MKCLVPGWSSKQSHSERPAATPPAPTNSSKEYPFTGGGLELRTPPQPELLQGQAGASVSL